ncbi:MAG: glycerophosphodiester phosphodiesterase [Candidatus Acidiferrales bacterium]
MKRPLIVAHRGARGRRLENTVAGFRDGVARGAEWVELDIHRTADGALVVFHDFALGGRRLAQLALEEAKQRAVRRGAELPTLEEVFDALPRSIGVNIEIKAPGIGRELISLLARRRATRRVLVSSFHHPTIRDLAALRPRAATGLLARRPMRDPVGALRRAGARALVLHHTAVNAKLTEQAQRAGFAVWVWTVNRERDLRRMLALGVDAVITDYPEKLLRLRDSASLVA